MNWFTGNIKRIDADRLFSLFIRIRDGWKCQYKFKCSGVENFENNKGQLDCSHFQKRGKWSVRYDTENADAGCKKCHWFIENHPVGQKTLEKWKLNQLGEQRYKALIIRANIIGRRDDKLAKIYVQQLLKEQKNTNDRHDRL